MFKNYLKIAWRNLVKDRQFTFLNLMGLSIGLACSFLIYLWVHDELSIDKFNSNDKRLYQVIKTAPNADGTISTYETTQGLLARSMAEDLPEIEYAVSVRKQGGMGILSADDKHIKASWEFVDRDFFNVFSYDLIHGNKSTALSDKYGVLLSDKLALKLFNTTENIIGKSVNWDHDGEFNGSYTIAAIFKAPPSSASDQFDILFTYPLYIEKELGTMGDVSYWGSNMAFTYLVLKKGIEANLFNNSTLFG